MLIIRAPKKEEHMGIAAIRKQLLLLMIEEYRVYK
jgi:hypothetical protein